MLRDRQIKIHFAVVDVNKITGPRQKTSAEASTRYMPQTPP